MRSASAGRLGRDDIVRAVHVIATPRGGYAVHHDVEGEAIVCEVPSLEIARCIVKALRDRLVAVNRPAVPHTKKTR